MRKIVWLSGFLSVVIVASGCSKLEELISPAKSPAEETTAEVAAPLEAEGARPEAPADPAPGAEVAVGVAEEAAGASATGGASGGEAAGEAEEVAAEEPPKIERFRAALVENGFVAVDVEPLLPDVLGGLRDVCGALERNRVNLENEDWTTLGIFETPEQAKTCLAAYLKTPGADRIRNSYVQTGPYVLEVRPSMDAARQSKIKSLFAKVVAE